MSADLELMKKLVRRAASGNLNVRDEAIKLGIVQPDFMDVEWTNYSSRCRFIANVVNDVVRPSRDDFKDIPDDAIKELLDRENNAMTPGVIQTLVDIAQDRIVAARAKPAEAVNIWNFVFKGKNHKVFYPSLLLALMPVCTEVSGSDWTTLEEVVKTANDTALMAAFQEIVALKMADRAAKGRKTRQENLAAGVKRSDPFTKALETDDLNHVLRYELKNFDRKRFDRVKDLWLTKSSNVKTAMMYCKAEFWAPYRKELLAAWLDESGGGRRCYNLVVDIGLEEWKQMEPDLQLGALDRFFSSGARLAEWPTLQETSDLTVALKLMGEKHDTLCKQLQEWMALRKIAVMAGKERHWPRPSYDGYAQKANDFAEKLGATKGKLLQLVIDNSEIEDIVPVLDAMDPVERKVAAKLVMQDALRKSGVSATFIKEKD